MHTQVLKVDPLKITFDGVKSQIKCSQTYEALYSAAAALRRNRAVAFPTETVYGLGANCQSDEAVQRIYAAKNRPADNPLIIHVASQAQIATLLGSQIPKIYEPLVEKFWPGPLTILLPLPSQTKISEVCTQGQSTFGCRMPSNPVARALIEISGLPLAAPSANASTRPSCTTAEHTLEDLDGKIELILDGGPADVGVESTVVDGLVDPPQILRPGGVSIEQIKEAGGPAWQNLILHKPTAEAHEKVRTPGMKYRHYSPSARVVAFMPGTQHLLAEYTAGFKGKIALLTSLTWPAGLLPGAIELPLGTTPAMVSHNLFTHFRTADASGADLILVEGIPLENEGLAVMNRINKAASETVCAGAAGAAGAAAEVDAEVDAEDAAGTKCN